MSANSTKHSMYYGLILGSVFILNFLLQTLGSLIFNYLHIFLTISIFYIVFYFAKNCRETIFGGKITFSQTFFYVVKLFFYAALISSAFKFFYFKFINPDFLNLLYNQSVKVLEGLQMPATDEVLRQMRETSTPWRLSMQYVWANVLVGCFVGIFVGLFIKKEN